METPQMLIFKVATSVNRLFEWLCDKLPHLVVHIGNAAISLTIDRTWVVDVIEKPTVQLHQPEIRYK